ncbi:D(2) dopamine receptor [Strongylocentrotus purpuratus]|uniref:G-protein coupled receptors family 1 profile domain-containing protein n=1 Tax=Strongylocentrotus purpuratus TaxID=7668 RepID=A0A7M7GGS7_STRPU|nr:D(2) dopamine receptor [Strongylocentrotus purpuratus]
MAYMRDSRIRENITYAYILNLALADLLVGVVLVINTGSFYTGTWSFGGLLCILAWVLDYSATTVSVLTIIAISVDRYLMVQNPLRHRSRQSCKKVAIICSILWITCLAAHSTLAFTYSSRTGFMHDENRIAACDLGYGNDVVIISMMSVVGYLVPGLCVFSLNLKVYFQLKRRSSNFQPRLSMDQLGSSEVPFKDGRTRTSSCRLNDIRIHGSSATGFQHRKAARFLTFLLIVFVLCWSPFYIYHCYTFVTSWGNYSVVVDNVVSLILWSNSAINPFLYAFTNVFFKENFMHFLRCK